MGNGTENKLGAEAEGKLLLENGVPMMLSLFVAAFYNLADTFFVSQISGTGEAAAKALSLTFPVQMMMTALNVGTGVGVGAALSRALGEKDREKAGRVAGCAMFLYFLYYVLMLLFGLFAAHGFLARFTAEADVLAAGVPYLTLVSALSFGNMAEKCFEKLLQSAGRTLASMTGQMLGAFLNVALDPLFIFGGLGIPAMGTAGAAAATVIGQCLAATVTGTIYFRKNREIGHRLRYLRPDARALRDILSVGVPAVIAQGLSGVSALGMNFILKNLSAQAITAYGVYYKLQNFIFMPAFGINNACVPILGYNLGAKRWGRVERTVRLAALFALSVTLAGAAALRLFAEPVVGLFGLSPEFTALCVTAVRVMTWGFPFAGLSVLLSGVSQALGGGLEALLISVLRLILLVLPLAALLASMPDGETLVWFAFPAAEIVTLPAAAWLTARRYGKIRKGETPCGT